MSLRRWMCMLLAMSSLVDVGKGPEKDVAPNSTNEPELTAEDKKLLEGLIGDLLIDPKGKDRVVVRSNLSRGKISTATGWYVQGKDNCPGRIYFADGSYQVVVAGKSPERLDFVKDARERYSTYPPRPENEFIEVTSDQDLAMAVWLYRLGEERLAFRALANARRWYTDPVKCLRESLRDKLYENLIVAFMGRRDSEAMEYALHFLTRYPDEARVVMVRQVVCDLQRRYEKGTFGKQPPTAFPNEYDRWEIQQKLDYLIDSLDELEAHELLRNGELSTAGNHKEQLIEFEDAAVPALLERMENDNRLTRAVPRDEPLSRATIIQLRVVWIELLERILGVYQIARMNPDIPRNRDETEQAWRMRLIRAYWQKYGGIPRAERMMNTLRNPHFTYQTKYAALWSLLDSRKNAPSYLPLLMKFSQPTVAEAIFQMMDTEVAEVKRRQFPRGNQDPDWSPWFIEKRFVDALVLLGDNRIGEELSRRSANATHIKARLGWAEAAYRFGEISAVELLVTDFLQGRIPISRDNIQGESFSSLMNFFQQLRIPETTCLFEEIASPESPFFSTFEHHVMLPWWGRLFGPESFQQSHLLPFLRRLLDDSTVTGHTISIRGNQLEFTDVRSHFPYTIPEFLADPAMRRGSVEERKSDKSAEKLQSHVLGLPLYHPLFKDADERLKKLKLAYDRFEGHYRLATHSELVALGLSPQAVLFLPDIPTLDRPATADDVKRKRAIFHLNGNGKRAPIQLPATAILKRDAEKKHPERVLIVQAEMDAKGELIYGVIMQHDVRAISAKELVQVKSVEQFAKEENARLTQDKKLLD